MKIIFPSLLPANAYKVYLADLGRFATMTSVKFVDRNTFIACHLLGKKMFLVSFDFEKETHEIIQTLDTTYKGELAITDLMDYNGKYIATSNFDHGSVTIYEFKDKKISYLKDLPTNNKMTHGVRFVPLEYGTGDLICCTFNNLQNLSLQFINFLTNEVYYEIKCNLIPKDVYFIEDNQMLVTYCSRGGFLEATKEKIYSEVHLYSLDLSNKSVGFLDSIKVDNAHVDGIAYKNRIAYVSYQNNDTLIRLEIQEGKLIQMEPLVGFNFPHGLDIYENLLGVSNYGDNSIAIQEIAP